MIDLIAIGGSPAPEWPHGRVLRPDDDGPAALQRLVERELPRTRAEGWLFWDPALGTPDAWRLRSLLAETGDVWHAGLRLGLAGLPSLLDAVAPTWTLNRDPAPGIVATS